MQESRNAIKTALGAVRFYCLVLILRFLGSMNEEVPPGASSVGAVVTVTVGCTPHIIFQTLENDS